MRAITKESVAALMAGRDYKNDNTQVTDGALWLHKTPIVEMRHDGMYIQTGGWNTSTTKERLNGFMCVRVCTHKHQLYLNGQPWDGEWIKVRDI